MKTETKGPEGPKEIGERATLAVADLSPNPANRKLAKDEEIKNLARSIREVGLLYPIIVRPMDEPGKYRIVAGERRFRALRRLGIETAPCVVVRGDGAENETIGIVENHVRKNPTPLEEAAAVRHLLDAGLEPEAVARSLGRSRSWVSRRSSLTELSEVWREALADEERSVAGWPASHLELVARFPAEVQDGMLARLEETGARAVPGFADLRRFTGGYLRLLASAPWKTDDETLVPEVGSCAACPKRSSCRPDLFEEEMPKRESGKDDRCLDPECWDRKAKAFLSRRFDALGKTHPNLAVLTDGTECRAPDGVRVVRDREATVGKKSDEGAIPALVVSGPGLGRVKWIVPPLRGGNGYRAHGTNGAAAEGADAPKAEKTPEERREPYDRRRRQVAIDDVKKRVEALARAGTLEEAKVSEGGPALVERGLVAKTLVLLAILLDGFGWRRDAGRSREEVPEELSRERLDGLRNRELGPEETRNALFAIAWRLQSFALEALADRMTVAPGERANALQYREAEWACELLGYDLAAIRAEAARVVPYAKAWRESVEDCWHQPTVGRSVSHANCTSPDYGEPTNYSPSLESKSAHATPSLSGEHDT